MITLKTCTEMNTIRPRDMCHLFEKKYLSLFSKIKEDINLSKEQKLPLIKILDILKDVTSEFFDHMSVTCVGEGKIWKYQGVKYSNGSHELVFAENDVSNAEDRRDFIFSTESYHGVFDINTELKEVCVNYEDFGDCLDNLDFWIHLKSIYQEMKSLMRLIEK